MNQGSQKTGATLIGFAVFGLFVVGVTALIGGALAIANGNEYIGAGVLLLAAASSFGVILYPGVRS